MTAEARINRARGAIYGVASAALFGVSAPLAKRLLPDVGPMLLAGILYLGAGAGLTMVSLVRGRPWPRFERHDWQRLALIAVIGGFAGPTLLLVGLTRVSGVLGSLLLNLEAVFTMLIAVAWFGDRLGRREWLAAVVILTGAATVSYRPGELRADWMGVLAIAGACLCWGFDNNLLQRVSSHDPISVVQIKTLSAGALSLVLSLSIGQRLTGPSVIPAALGVGFVCYGISIVFDVYALRYLGAAREAAFFATAPFIGALAAVPLLGDRFTRADALGGALMALGVVIFRLRLGGTASRDDSQDT